MSLSQNKEEAHKSREDYRKKEGRLGGACWTSNYYYLTTYRERIDIMTHDNNPNPPQVRFLTPSETAEILGVSEKTLREATKRKEIPVLSFGSTVRYNYAAISNLGLST